MNGKWIGLAAAGVLVTACSSDPHVQHSTVGGAAIGALAGGIIGNNTGSGNAATGAVVGAVVGGVAGAAKGCSDVGGCGHRQYYDQRNARYYYFDKHDGRYYWENGEPRY